MHGAEIQWKVLSVTYWVVKTGEKRRPAQPTKAFKEADSFVQKDDVSPVEMEIPSEEPLGMTAATPEELHETIAPSEPPPPEAAAETNAETPDLSPRNSELEALQTLYDAEMKHRIALQAENELLREELETMKRTLEMAESRLKILQLESDRPLWEAAKKKREENERAERAKEEERRRVAELEESRRKMREFQEQEKERKRAAEEAKQKERLRREAEEKARREKEERERKQREKEESERKARELREKLEREKRWRAATQAEEARCQKRDAELWGAGAWTPLRALERFKLQMEEFDKIKFSETQPLTFHAVPWPVLTDPLDLDIEEIDWKAVEAFFARVKVQLAANVAEYKSLVEKVHRMFHPDKWRSRGLLATVMDGDLKMSLETTGNVVAQAMTPLWRKSKGYTDT
jgi:DNA repair exonuclease SbcCD ATPase subunit